MAYNTVTWLFFFVAIISLVTGAVFMMWLGEQITEKGVGNGISLLIFAGIVAGLPAAIGQSLKQARQGDINILVLLFILAAGDRRDLRSSSSSSAASAVSR